MISKPDPVSRAKTLQLIDHYWMVENPDCDEYAFLFRLIQERHRTQFLQAIEVSPEGNTEVLTSVLQSMDDERSRAEEILSWLYLDSQLRQQGKTLPDELERLESSGF
jgi:ubiquinone biosynthesis protein UbiJ